MNNIIKFGGVLFILAAVCAGILGFANGLTAPVVAEMAIAKETAARQKVLGNAETFDETKKVEAGDLTFIPGFKGSEKVGYVVKVVGPGYGGDLVLLAGVGLDGKLTGMDVLDAKETPGLGDKILNPEWQKRWVGADKNYEFKVGIDSFAGATISPRAVHTALMTALRTFTSEVKN